MRMRASCRIVCGSFYGGDIEPGTFHHWVPPQLRNQPQQKAPGDQTPVIKVPPAEAPNVVATGTEQEVAPTRR